MCNESRRRRQADTTDVVKGRSVTAVPQLSAWTQHVHPTGISNPYAFPHWRVMSKLTCYGVCRLPCAWHQQEEYLSALVGTLRVEISLLIETKTLSRIDANKQTMISASTFQRQHPRLFTTYWYNPAGIR